ncbi:MAG: Rad52/Rad22 family DNA repair protein [Silicimonas sp.]|jgi:DNA recombination protein Rad52|uniref:Rad52/Rad22 family DNA repair protein n=1 Tax=Roseitalea porphyridii TaxID=1852022 RepID=UPI0032EAED70
MGLSDKQTRQLRSKLRPKHIRSRTDNGQTFLYLEGWHVIAEANRIFGFDGWSRETVDCRCVYTKRIGERYEAVDTARVRVRVHADGTDVLREGSGAGEANTTSPGQAHEYALKAAETDATKRALVTFGNAFGLSLYANGSASDGRSPEASRPAGPRLNGTSPNPNHGTSPEKAEALARSSVNPDRYPPEAGPAKTGSGIPKDQFDNPDGHASSSSLDGPSVTASAIAAPEKEAIRPHGGPMPTMSAESQSRLTKARRPACPIDKSALTLSEPKRIRDPDHLRFVAKQPCLICGRNRAQAHHLTFAQPGAMGRKVSDEFTVPLCSVHHQALHQRGDERAFWTEVQIDPIEHAARLWRARCSGVDAVSK